MDTHQNTINQIETQDPSLINSSNNSISQQNNISQQTDLQSINPWFEDTVESLLTTKLQPFQIQTKQYIYESYIKSLTPEEKQLKMTIIRCVQDLKFPEEIQETIKNDYQTKNRIVQEQNVFMYNKSENKNERHWYVNFADQHLFGFYYSSLFAQDEIQVCEHPLLAHVFERSTLLSKNHPDLAPKTYSKNTPTPILVSNAYRLGTIDIKPSADYPSGLYGNNFQKMNMQGLKNRMTVFNENKTISNIIAMAAIGYQRGIYTEEQIEFTLKTAYKSFLCAKQVSNHYDSQAITVIHTGNWGCGAFGNNPILIAILQLLAAQLAQVDVLYYHTFDKNGTASYNLGKQQYEMMISELFKKKKSVSMKEVLKYIYKLKLKWGHSDGN